MHSCTFFVRPVVFFLGTSSEGFGSSSGRGFLNKLEDEFRGICHSIMTRVLIRGGMALQSLDK